MTDTLDDDQVVILAQQHPAEFEKLYERYFERIYRYCHKRTTNTQVAEDLCSDIFVTVLAKLKLYRPNGKFAAWLFQIAHNTVIDHYRKQKPITAIDHLHLKDDTQMQQTIANQLLVADMLSDLNDEEREILVLRLEAELSAPEIAELTGKTANAIRVQIYRLLKRLRDRYNHSLRGDEA